MRKTIVATIVLGIAFAVRVSIAEAAGTQTCGTGSASSRTAVLSVTMPCPACSVGVRAALKRLDGVSEAKVSAANNSASVEYDPTKVTTQQMLDAIHKLGYHASLSSKGS